MKITCIFGHATIVYIFILPVSHIMFTVIAPLYILVANPQLLQLCILDNGTLSFLPMQYN